MSLNLAEQIESIEQERIKKIIKIINPIKKKGSINKSKPCIINTKSIIGKKKK
jgi:hypothetical protein